MNNLKEAVRTHWEQETCGTRYGDAGEQRATFFADIAEARYKLEPYIEELADFPSARGKRVLEIGVGAGADFVRWCREASFVNGVDLTTAAIELTRERTRLAGLERYELQVADAENLPFADATFDIVYAYGVLHHSPDTAAAFREVARVLKPGGTFRGMVYQPHSWVGLMLAIRYRKTMRAAMYTHLESPGTKSYTPREASALLRASGLKPIWLSPRLSPADLLTSMPSAKYAAGPYQAIWRLYPRWLVRALGDRFGTHLLFRATR